MLYKHFNVAVTKADDEKSIISAIFSTADEDRHGEVVDQASWELKEYLQNPVVLFAHDHFQPAIGKAINLTINANGNLEGDIQFAAKEYEFANTIYKLYRGGYMRAFSVGFQNEAVEIADEGQTVILKQNHLYEISTVNVPANAMALAKSKGIDISPLEKFMREKEGRVLSAKTKTVIENARNALDELLSADADKSIKAQVPSSDTAVQSIKVETPHSKGVTKHSAAALLNKAVRTLLQEKRNLTN